MFNGYNETPLISYEFNQERVDKKPENATKWSYGHEPGLQPPQTHHPTNRHPDFWPPKPGFVGLSNVVKCTCTGCYPTAENQSYQGDTTRHRPWLPRTFPVPLNGSNDPCKLPPYQWDNGSLSQGPCYPEASGPFVQETGGKHGFYRHYQESRLPEPNQAGVITSLKSADFGKKPGKEEAVLQNDMRQPVFCNPVYNLTKRADGRNYCDPNEKYSNAASFPADQHIPRLPVIEPYIKAVPSNISENRVPSTGYRSVKENVCQPYAEGGYGDSRKMSGEVEFIGEKRNEGFPTGPSSSGAHVDYSHFGRDLTDTESQKLFFENARHSEYFSRKNFDDVMSRNNLNLEKKKDCAMSQIGEMSLGEQQYGVARNKYPDPGKSSCQAFYPKDLNKMRPENHPPESSPCFHRNQDKNENMNVHARLARSTLIFNEPRFPEKTQNSFSYQNNPAFRNYPYQVRPEYPYQGYDSQHRYEYSPAFQRNDFHYCRPTPHQAQTSDNFMPQQPNTLPHDSQSHNSDKTHIPPVLADSLPPDTKTPSLLNPIRSEVINKNGATKISPLRLLRKKKFINVPHEPTPMPSTLDAAPGLDVRKFWSTWAEEEEENVAPTQMVVLDCQNIDLEQAKLLHLYETDPVRTVSLESGNALLKDSGKGANDAALPEVVVPKPEEQPPAEQKEIRESAGDAREKNPKDLTESESKICEPVMHSISPTKCKIVKPGPEKERSGKKGETMDKWTEKKFDFLKRSEELKAAEMLRHEEEKKKILETRLSLQQSLRKTEKAQEKRGGGKPGDEKSGENMSSFDENSQGSSPDRGSGDVSELPTCEYRRNKFLDYSEKKVVVNGGGKHEEDKDVIDDKLGKYPDLEEVAKENVKVEKEPLLDTVLKEEPCSEIDNILQKMSEINFKTREILPENGKNNVTKKWKSSTKKLKKKKSDHQSENEQRPDKLTLEKVKFSIQKSHDLKISFKVLNNSKKCSEEEEGNEFVETQKNVVEDSQNSTELITLSYKSIQRDGDQRSVSDKKKSRRRFRRKKHASVEKTPVLKIKKSRYMPQSERDPLGNYEDDDNHSQVPENPYLDEYPTSNDFHVHETVDSAKIKLTFKRHKADFETQYRINNNSVADISELELEEPENHRRKSVRVKEDIFAEAGIESFQDTPEVSCDIDSGEESISGEANLTETPEDDARNTVLPLYCDAVEEKLEPETEVLCQGLGTFEEEPVEVKDGKEGPKMCGEREEKGEVEKTDKSGGEKVEGAVEAKMFWGWGEGNWKDSESGKVDSSQKKQQKEEADEISLDFISSTNSEIETNHRAEKTEESEGSKEEKPEEINDSEIEKRFFESKPDDGEGVVSVAENLWDKSPVGSRNGDLEDEREAFASPLPLPCDNENVPENKISCDDRAILDQEDSREILSSDEAGPVEENTEVTEGKDEEPKTEENAIEEPAESDSKGEPLFTDAELASGDSGKHFIGDVETNESEKESKAELQCTEESRSTKDSDRTNVENYDVKVSFEERNNEEVNQFHNIDDCSESKSLDDLLSPKETISEAPESTFEDRFKVQPPSAQTPKGDARKEEVDGRFSSAEVVTEVTSNSENHLKFETNKTTETNIEDSFFDQPPAEAVPTESSTVSEKVNEDDSEINNQDDSIPKVLPLSSDVELEEGEIVSSSDDDFENSTSEKEKKSDVDCSHRKPFEFVNRKPTRRNSNEMSGAQKCFQFHPRYKRKAKSCPPEVSFKEEQKKIDVALVVPTDEIPLPFGPAPQNSCFNFKKPRMTVIEAEAKEKPKESITTDGVSVKPKTLEPESPSFESPSNDTQNSENVLVSAPETPPLPEIFQRSSKIKFSFTRRSRFSKIGLKSTNEKSPEIPAPKEEEKKEKVLEVEPNPKTEPRKEEDKLESDKKEEIKMSRSDSNEECEGQSEGKCEKVENIASETEKVEKQDEEELKKDESFSFEQLDELVEDEEVKSLVGENLEENIEDVNAMSEYMRDEFYECEDIPTSEDLTNGDDLENEKVNDDKFRNIMQNCLDNAKKFLNVGNLKLFSCSVDDLLELDCQALDSALEEQEAKLNHISRDVLLASCEDTNDELALSENAQPPDISMDFVPSFCSDVCPEILPVDNWPYLEEEVPSSPTKPKQDDADLIPPLETVSSASPKSAETHQRQFHSEMKRRKRVDGESCFNRFRRRSLLTDGEAIRMCSKVGAPRRNTVDGFGGEIKTELLRWKTDEMDKQSLKCRVNLEKLEKHENSELKIEGMKGTSDISRKQENGFRKKNGKSLDYKSPSWQPKVMLFRISKNEIRKLRRKNLKLQKCSESKMEMNSDMRTVFTNLENEPTKPRPVADSEDVYIKLERFSNKEEELSPNEEKTARLPGLESIKGSLSVMQSSDERKRKKSRFRNLHKKRKTEHESTKDVLAIAHESPSKKPMLVDAETILTEMFRDCDRVPNPSVKSTKEVIHSKDCEKPKRKTSETLLGQETSIEAVRPREDSEHHKDTKKKEGFHKDRRREKDEHRKHEDRHKRSESSHRSSKSKEKSKDRFRSSSGGEGKLKKERDSSPRERWQCAVCGFSNAEERTSHIKSHPFHCQSCYLAFKTEAHFVSHLTKRHKDIRNQHHCLLCELSFNTEEQYQGHLETREHKHLEAVEKNTINTLFTLLTGSPCPVLGLVEAKPEWMPNQPGTVHFYHQATPLSLALQYLKMHHDLTSFSTVSSAHPK